MIDPENEAESPAPPAAKSENALHLIHSLYEELRTLAERYFQPSTQGYHTLQPTALVHEVFIRMSHYSPEQQFQSKSQFYRAAAESMRQILIENYRRKSAIRRGGHMIRLAVPLQQVPDPTDFIDLLELDDLIETLARNEPLKAELVKLRFFCGLTIEEAADALAISHATADRWWAYAKAFLAMKMGK
ncbi:MAG: ECF-type sigma factor [Isosphaeraceae bacterium]